MIQRKSRIETGFGVFVLALALSGGCRDRAPEATAGGPSGAQSSVGAIDVGLAVPPSFQIATVNYQLTKTGFSQSGSLDVSTAQSISGVLGGIPAGTGYTLTLTATDTANKFTGCSGSSPVNVVGGTTTSVNVAVDCHLPASTVITPPPAVPVPMPAVALLAVGLLATGLLTNGRRGGRRPFRRE